MASTYTSSIRLELPARNDYQNTWDVPVNSNFTAIDGKLGGTVSIALSNVEVDLTKVQAQSANIVFTGTISANISVTLPNGFGGIYSVLNGTIGAFTVALSINGATGAALSLPQGIRALVIADGTNVYLADQSGLPPGTPLPRLSPIIPGGFILGYGQVLNISDQPGIYACYGTTFNTGGESSGTFRMPDMRGVTFAGLDNMGGVARGLLTAFGASGTVLGAVGGEQAHALSAGENGAHNHSITDLGHTHGTTEPTHNHTIGISETLTPGSGGPTTAEQNQGTTTTSNSVTGLSVNSATTGISIVASGSGTAHNNVQPTMLCNWMIKT